MRKIVRNEFRSVLLFHIPGRLLYVAYARRRRLALDQVGLLAGTLCFQPVCPSVRAEAFSDRLAVGFYSIMNFAHICGF